jgi:uncharacterized protein YndB with AHSA1/START domain
MVKVMTKESPFVFRIERVFDAPRERVWKAWTDPEQIKQWFGPKGCTIPNLTVDLHPDGASVYDIEFEGSTIRGQWEYLEIKELERIVALVSFLDADGNKICHPMMLNWPMDVHSVVTFTALGDKTKITVEWTAHNASTIEREVFEKGAPSMQQGWSGSFEQLKAFLSKG